MVFVLLTLGLWLVGNQASAAPDSPPPYQPVLDPPRSTPAVPATWPEIGVAGPVRPQGVGAWDSWWVGTPTVISDGGQLEMWYIGADPSWVGQIGQATSPDGIGWTKSASNPLLPGWEAEVRKEGPADYKMWVTRDESIYRATSTDGLAWTVDATPALSPTLQDGTFDRDAVGDPSIVVNGGVYWMFYNGYTAQGDLWQIGAATSTDGIHWTRVQAAPVLGPGGPGAWDENHALDPMIILDGGTFKMWYSAFDANWVRRIGYATSPDGVNWTKYASNPVFEGAPGQWDDGGVHNMAVLHDNGYHMWYSCNGQIGYVTSPDGIDWTRFLSGPVLSPGPSLYIDVNYAHDWVEGRTTLPNATVVITVADGEGIKATATGQADGGGWFGTHGWPWDPQQPNIAVGDTILAAAAGLTTTIDPIGAIDATTDTSADTVYGAIHAPWFSPLTLTVRCEIWQENGPSIEIPGVDADGGEYLCDFAGQWDIQPWEMVAVRYIEPDGDTVINIAAPLDLLLNVNYGHDWVEGDYEAGHTVWITLTESDGATIKDTAVLTTGEVPWWGGRIGFSTSWQGWTSGGWPDLQAGDWVYGRVDTGYAATVRICTIEGTLDLDADTIAGNIYAPWFTQTLNGDCGVWEPGGPGQGFQVEPDGGAYFCDFGAMGWDLLPGHDVGVSYQEPDGDRVYNVFREPAPNMRIEKWAEASGQAMPGGPAVFTLRYRNEGDAEATAIYLTDTLPANTVYVADGSGVAPTIGAGWVAWTLGPLGPGEERQFQLVLSNTANPGDTLHNAADIWTLYDDDYGNNHAEADVQVVEGQPDLYVNKNPNPGDPAPGQTMLWEINYGNSGPVASGPVILTDTIPQDTSIVGWFSENGYNLWTDHSTAGQLILEAPTIPGYWGDRILLRLLVDDDVPVGTQLTNTVEITTTGDTNPGDNRHMRNDVWVGNPRWDSFVDKNFGWGRLVPGGQVEYNLHARNGGNMATYTVVTDTLPAGTSFDQSWRCSGPTCVPFPPDYVDDQVAVWDLGVQEPGEWANFNVRLNIAGDAEPGAVLTNCAEVVIAGDDNWPYNNTDCVVEMVHNFGPNLRINKYYQWNWEGQLEYTIEFRNLGTTTLQDFAITDTLPDGVAFNGNWWHWFHRSIAFEQVGDQLIWTVDWLEPTWAAGLRYQADLDSDLVGVQGLCFVNAAEAPIAGDVWPADNSDEAAACTGPDVYVVKWLSGGEPMPGEVLTFTVEFGNQSRWPWNGDDQYGSHLTETLPAGMTFITATAPWNPDEPWPPERIDGNTIVWGWGPMWADSRWRFDLVVELDRNLRDGAVLINRVEARGDSPDDVEPNYDNNVYELPVEVTVNLRFIYLPIVLKNH